MKNQTPTHTLSPFTASLSAGLLATFPMTFVMELGFRALPKKERYPLPPQEITDVLATQLIQRPLSSSTLGKAALIQHFAYGTATGATFPLVERALPQQTPLILKGATFGCAVWLAGYMGWLPAFRILKPATQHPARRNLLMLGAHLAYSISAAWLSSRMRHSRSHHSTPHYLIQSTTARTITRSAA